MSVNDTSAKDGGGTGRLERHDFLSTVLLSLATVLTAWAAFQAAAWSDEQNKADDAASEALIESARFSSAAGAYTVVDVVLWNQWMNDVNREHAADPSRPLPGPGYTPTPGTDSASTERRFRSDFKPAFKAWLETDPLVDPSASPVPFSLPEYQLAQYEESDQLRAKATRLMETSDEEADTTREYVALAVAYAAVLALAAVSVKLRTVRARETSLVVAAVLFVAVTVVIATLPIST
ncbi:MAG TPA: hypothetical protein VIH82_11850 [Acidimicrobiia bacterium]